MLPLLRNKTWKKHEVDGASQGHCNVITIIFMKKNFIKTRQSNDAIDS